MISKKSRFVISAGRTGTSFLARFLNSVLPDCYAVHEPDVFRSDFKYMKENIQILKEFGLFHSVFGKLLNKTSMIAISNKYISNKISKSEAIKLIYQQRKDYIESINKDIYVECNRQLFGVIDIIPEIFKDYKIIYMIRDGRDWVRSYTNFYSIKNIFHNKKILALLPDNVLNEWKKMDTFERSCWYWTAINNYSIDKIKGMKNVHTLKYEDLFVSDKRTDNLKKLSYLLSGKKDIDEEAIGNFLDKKINISNGDLGAWEEWNAHQKNYFKEVCGDLMSSLRYW